MFQKLIFRILIIFLILSVLVQNAYAKHLHPEKYYQNQWCGKWNGVQEYRLKDKSRVDCVTKNYAVEFDFAPKWAESVGQSLYYAEMTGKKPAIILIIEKTSDWKHFKKLKKISQKNGITLWYMKSPNYGQKEYKGYSDSIKKYFDKIYATL